MQSALWHEHKMLAHAAPFEKTVCALLPQTLCERRCTSNDDACAAMNRSNSPRTDGVMEAVGYSLMLGSRYTRRFHLNFFD